MANRVWLDLQLHPLMVLRMLQVEPLPIPVQRGLAICVAAVLVYGVWRWMHYHESWRYGRMDYDKVLRAVHCTHRSGVLYEDEVAA